MRRLVEQPTHGCLLDDAPGIHDGDAVRHLGNDAEVVGDEQQRQSHAALQIAQQVEDLRLDGDVERGRRLVGDEQRRAAGEGQRDQRALTQAARELMRILPHPALGLGHAHRLQEGDGLLARVAARRAAVYPQRLFDLVADREDRVERRHRLLEHEADLGAAHALQFALGQRQQVARARGRAQHDAAGVDPSRPLDQPHDRQRRQRLAAAGLADKAQGLAGVDVKADVDDGRHEAVLLLEAGGEVAHCQQRRGAGGGCGRIRLGVRRHQTSTSLCPPNTARMASEISPTVARCSTAWTIGGTRLSLPRAAAVTASSAARHAA